MGRAKDIVLKVIPATIANPFVKAHHYSGSVVGNSKLHFGVFLDGQLHGVMSYGPSMNKQQMIGLVEGTGWNEFMELNRMAFDSVLPRNSESRAIAMSIRLLKKYAPQVKWLISFADACSCGDGTIYRAANFVLTGIKPNEALCILPDGTRLHKMALSANPTTPRKELGGRCYFDYTNGRFAWKEFLQASGSRLLEGWQLRYIYFISADADRAHQDAESGGMRRSNPCLSQGTRAFPAPAGGHARHYEEFHHQLGNRRIAAGAEHDPEAVPGAGHHHRRFL